MNKTIAMLCLTCSLSAHAEDGSLGPTANEVLYTCTHETSTNHSLCTGYFGGYLDGLIYGTTIVDWNLPQGQSLSAQTIKNSFIKLLGDKPIFGDQPIGIATTYALISQGIVKEKNKKTK